MWKSHFPYLVWKTSGLYVLPCSRLILPSTFIRHTRVVDLKLLILYDNAAACQRAIITDTNTFCVYWSNSVVPVLCISHVANRSKNDKLFPYFEYIGIPDTFDYVLEQITLEYWWTPFRWTMNERIWTWTSSFLLRERFDVQGFFKLKSVLSWILYVAYIEVRTAVR